MVGAQHVKESGGMSPQEFFENLAISVRLNLEAILILTEIFDVRLVWPSLACSFSAS